mmetsp:Transcript_29040/g.63206  ORF Transcript_29040/g.63206 Transcript_29040/m.63206 type:complete len:277 (+) Transcript_29040:192-1022(+)
MNPRHSRHRGVMETPVSHVDANGRRNSDRPRIAVIHDASMLHFRPRRQHRRLGPLRPGSLATHGIYGWLSNHVPLPPAICRRRKLGACRKRSIAHAIDVAEEIADELLLWRRPPRSSGTFSVLTPAAATLAAISLAIPLCLPRCRILHSSIGLRLLRVRIKSHRATRRKPEQLDVGILNEALAGLQVTLGRAISLRDARQPLQASCLVATSVSAVQGLDLLHGPVAHRHALASVREALMGRFAGTADERFELPADILVTKPVLVLKEAICADPILR